MARIAETRNRVQLQRRLAAKVTLKCVISVEDVVDAGVVAHVTGPLVDVHRCGLRADETRCAVDRCIWLRNELQQLSRNWIRHAGTFGRGEHAAVDIDPLTLPQTLVRGEEERKVTRDRPTERRT